MTAGRGCERLAAADALARITERAGTDFDAAIVEVLGRTVGDGNLEANLPAVALPATPS